MRSSHLIIDLWEAEGLNDRERIEEWRSSTR